MNVQKAAEALDHWHRLAARDFCVPPEGLPREAQPARTHLLPEFLAWKYGDEVPNSFLDRFHRAMEVGDTLFLNASMALVESIEPAWNSIWDLKEDLLARLLTGEGTLDLDQIIEDLRAEARECVSFALAECEKIQFAPQLRATASWALGGRDVVTKQFLVLYALHLTQEYQEKFTQHSFRAFYFCKHELPQLIKSLQQGEYSGLLEFVHEARPTYIMCL